MASCQINITGTTGSVLIKYKLGSTSNLINASIGDAVYISSTSTNVTYTTISGDAIGASGCVSISSLASTCYLFEWQSPGFGCSTGDIFNAIILGATTSSITDVPFSSSYNNLSDALIALSNSNITPASGKITVNSNGTFNNHLIITILGTDIPMLRVVNPTTTFNSYLIGTTSSCIPSGYTAIEVCSTLEDIS